MKFGPLNPTAGDDTFSLFLPFVPELFFHWREFNRVSKAKFFNLFDKQIEGWPHVVSPPSKIN